MRKLKNTLYILDETAYLTLDGENVVIRCDGAEKRRMPFTTIEEIYCFSYPGASPALMGACAERGVNLCFFIPTENCWRAYREKPKEISFCEKRSLNSLLRRIRC